MNLRCTYCQTPFSVGRMEKLVALQRMEAENLHHYDAFCPRCRRANSVSRQRLEMFTPGWREGLKTLEAEAAQIEKEMTVPASAPVKTEPVAAAPLAATRNRHAPKPTVPAPAPTESQPTAKPASKSKPAATSSLAKHPERAKGKKPVTKAKPAAAKAKPAVTPSLAKHPERAKGKKPVAKAKKPAAKKK